MKAKIILIVVGILLISTEVFSQYQFGPKQTDYRRDLWLYYDNPVQSNGLGGLNTVYTIGREDIFTKRRAVYQWDISDLDIPDNSEINYVKLQFTYSKLGHSYELPVRFYNINYDMIGEEYFDEIFWDMNYWQPSIGYSSGSNNNIIFESSDPQDDFNLAIKNSLANNKFVLGLKWDLDHGSWIRTWGVNNATITLYIEFTPPTQTVYVEQKLFNNTSVDSVGLWNLTQNKFDKYAVPKTFVWDVGSDKTLQGAQKIISNEKYITWLNETDVVNHHTFTIEPSTNLLTSQFNPTQSGITVKNNLENSSTDGGNVEFRDPWFIDYPDPAFGNQLRNRGMNDAIFYQRPSPFNPTHGSQYKGVFLNQGWPNWEPPYYSVKSSTQDITLTNTGNPAGRSHKFYFRNWSYDANKISLQTPGSNETAVVFKTSDAVLSANLKGTNLSEDPDAYNTTSQRKIVKIPDAGLYSDGSLHSVYSSNNRIWYEMSTDNGATWSLLNNGQPLDDGQGKLPSIDYVQLLTYPAELDCWVTIIVYQESYGNGFKIKAKSFLRIDDGPYIYRNFKELASYSTESYSNNANPVLAIDNAGYITFVWERKSSPAGLYCRRGTITVNTEFINNVLGLFDDNSTKLGNINYNTSASSINPSITVSKTVYPGAYGRGRHLAWQENNEIKYATILISNQWPYSITLGTIETPSYASGYPSNYLPSLSLANGKPVLSWTGYYDGNIWKITGEQENLIRKRALVKVRATNGWPSVCTQLGDNVNYVNNNSVTSASEKTVIVWSQGTTPQSKWLRRTAGAYTSICNLSHSGIESQVTMGSDFNNMSAMVFNNQTIPRYFIKSTTNFSAECADGEELNKITFSDSIISYGRSGIVSKNGIEFVFNTGDVFIADSSVRFTFIPDTLMFDSAEELNTAARTEDFWLEEEVDFFFSNLYYVIRQELADSLLNEQDQVNFKVELVKVQSGDVVGTFDNITYNKNNLEKYASIHYLVNTSGIQAGEYYLRLVTTVAGEAGYNLSNIQRDEFDLNKLHYVNVSFKGETIPVTYELSQNYPNPFNPTTTIRYQIPKDGVVTLKVYDILGAEVATLVNEEKVAGKYEVSFNASSLASGVYIYRLNVNEYVNVKKMVLVK
ncbi:MAG TPA: T9SS type A sorting domain-containing protein [Ignavibacteriaceae bacterium]|nr:T9SS type A sorting domain-containing protein [Ignavibacteriaceae bacterium]